MFTLREFTESIINSFLGPNKSNKLVVEDKEACISRCVLQLFQKTCLQDPVSSLVEETLLAHHDLYGCSTLTLLAMWYFWSEEFKLALEDGCELIDIKNYSQNILESVISSLYKISISMDSLLISKTFALGRKSINLNISSQLPISIRYSSRHFSPSAENESEKFENSQEISERFCDIVKGLDHDSDTETSNIVSECWKRQLLYTKCKKFKTNGLLVCPITLPSSRTSVVDGLVLKSNFIALCSQHVKNMDTHRALIINGGITFEYVHLGFAPKVSISLEKTSNDLTSSAKEIWQRKCCELILQLQVDVLLVKEDIDPRVADFCLSHSVLVLPLLSWSILKILCDFLQYSPCSYILDCAENSVLKNVVINEWKPHNTYLERQYFTFSVSSDDVKKGLLQTIVLCHPSSTVLEMKEHQLWHLISRLNSAGGCGKLLPGGGKVEEHFCDHLRKMQSEEIADSKSRIISAIANGFLNYFYVVSKKQEMLVHNKVQDDLPSKVSAWYSAMSLALLTLQCDMSILNGSQGLRIL